MCIRDRDEGDDEKIETGLQERAVFDQHFLAGRILPEADGQVREIDAADQLAESRHEEVADERRDDLAECRADDHANREVDHVALHRELFEL